MSASAVSLNTTLTSYTAHYVLGTAQRCHVGDGAAVAHDRRGVAAPLTILFPISASRGFR